MPHFHDHLRTQGKTRGQSVCIVPYTAFTAAALTETIDWVDLDGEPIPADARIVDCWAEPLISFAGGAADFDLGESGGDLDELLAAVDMTAAPGTLTVHTAEALVLGAFKATYSPAVTVTSDVNVNTLTAGKAKFVIEWEQIHTD